MVFALMTLVLAVAAVAAAELVRLQCRRMLARPVRRAPVTATKRVVAPALAPATA